MSDKTRFAFWVDRDTLSMVKDYYKDDNCKTQSEYIEKAIRFYTGYLNTGSADAYLPRVLSEVFAGTIDLLSSRIGRLMFKQAVEASMLMHIIAADTDIDEETLERLRVRCLNDVKSSNGQISFADILRYQKSV